jgi:1L-myo-inositol 1-phosphate cytidylyltransferase / CDP-L-myo-inositol myo-inositolphosphotransferase
MGGGRGGAALPALLALPDVENPAAAPVTNTVNRGPAPAFVEARKMRRSDRMLAPALIGPEGSSPDSGLSTDVSVARTAIILAAGNGSRLGGGPKPLYRLLGLRLVERTVLALAAAGVRRFRVVVGAHGDEVRRGLARSRRLRGLAIEAIDCPDHALGNGHSLAAGAAGLQEPFFVVMADHVFDPAVAERLAAAGAEAPDSVHLATDDRIGEVFDLDDATKVVTAGGKIVALGKQLTDFDRVDVGLFWCPAWLAASIARLVGRGAHSVSEVMSAASARGRLRSCPIEPLLWQDVDTPAMAREARRRLLRSTGKPTDGPVSRLINRRISTFFTGLLAPLGVTPNVMTTVVFSIGLVAAYLAASIDYRDLVVAAVLIQLASILDGCDGELARVTFRRSPFGAWYDTITDTIRYMGMVVGAAVGLWRRDGAVIYLALGAGFLWAAVHLVRTMNAYVKSVKGAGTHLVVLAEVERQGSTLSRSPWYRFLLSIRKLMKYDVMAVLAGVALVLDLRLVLVAGGLFAVLAAQGVVEKAVGSSGGGQQRWWQRAASIAGLVGLVALVDAAPAGELMALLGRLGPGVPLLALIALGWMAAYARGLRAILDGAVSWSRLLYNRLVGEAFNVLTPLAGLGGDPLKVLDLSPHVGTARAIRAVVIDRFAYAAAGLLFSAAGAVAAVSTYAWEAPVERLLVGYAVGALLLAAVLFLAVTRPASTAWAAKLLRLAKLQAPVAPQTLAPRIFARALIWNLVGRVWGLVEIVVLLYFLGQDIRGEAVLAIGTILSVSGIIFFFVPSGIGVSEGAAVLALTMTGYGEAVGLAVGLGRRLRLMLTASAGVALSVLWRPAPPVGQTWQQPAPSPASASASPAPSGP